MQSIYYENLIAPLGISTDVNLYYISILLYQQMLIYTDKITLYTMRKKNAVIIIIIQLPSRGTVACFKNVII